MTDQLDRFRGCLLGLAIGDAHGAPFEGGVIERLLWRLIGRTRDGRRRFTDDTQMALDVAASLVEHGDVAQHDLARRFAAGYRWSRGYGQAAAKSLRRMRRGEPWQRASRAVHVGGSFGNGAAMRAPVVGVYFAARPDELVDAAQRQGEVTHAHALALEGAVLVAAATSAAFGGADAPGMLETAATHARSAPFVERLALARTWLTNGTAPEPAEVRRALGSRATATESVVTALHLAARFGERPFAELLAFAARCGGDVDTIAAIAGAIWGARRGERALPTELRESVEAHAAIAAAATALHDAAALRDAGAPRERR